MLHAHVGAMDCCARGLIAAAAMIEDGLLQSELDSRYAGWDSAPAQAMLAGDLSLEQIADRVEQVELDPQPRSGRQEDLENLVNRYL